MDHFDLSSTENSVETLAAELQQLRDGDVAKLNTATITTLGYNATRRFEITKSGALLLITPAPHEAARAALSV